VRIEELGCVLNVESEFLVPVPGASAPSIHSRHHEPKFNMEIASGAQRSGKKLTEVYADQRSVGRVCAELCRELEPHTNVLLPIPFENLFLSRYQSLAVMRQSWPPNRMPKYERLLAQSKQPHSRLRTRLRF
jgi:hypothetical protein